MERTFGRYHFYVHSKRRGSGKDWFVGMVSDCDQSTRFWINAKILKVALTAKVDFSELVTLELLQCIPNLIIDLILRNYMECNHVSLWGQGTRIVELLTYSSSPHTT